jgi:hypothetical protein
MLKNKKFVLSSIIISGLLSSVVVFAAPNINELTQDVAQKSGYDAVGTNEFTLSESVGKVIRVLLSLVGTIFLILMIYAGFLWMTAQGEEAKVTKALGIFKTSIMGLIIVLAGYGLTTFIVGVISTTTGVPGGKVGPGYGTGGFWTSFGKSLKDNWWNYIF